MKQSAKDSNSVTCSKDHSFHSVPTTLSTDWTKANISYLQPSRVEDLWTKAAKLLGTPGFVVSAAGNTSARQVASMSATDTSATDTSTPPHFVYAKKSQGCCTEVHRDCPVYSSTPKVCQHSLAAADDMGILSDYLAFLRKTKAVALNLSTLISNELPKSAGKKDSTSWRKGTPKGKKKPVLTEKDVLSLPSTSGNESHSINAENVPPESRFVPPVLPSTMPPFSPSPPYGYSGSFHFDQPFQPSCMNSYFSASPMPYHSSPVLDQVHTPSLMLNQSYTPSLHQYNQSGLSSQLMFLAKFIEGNRIRTCYGCGNPIRKDTTQVPPPPHDMIISYRERRLYRDPNTHQMRLTATEENTYYHAMRSCIMQKHPAFQVDMLKVEDSSLLRLSNVHRIHFKEQFNITL